MLSDGVRGKIINIGGMTLDKLINSNNMLIIDVRDRNEYKINHIKEAINIPSDYFDKYVKYIPQNKKIVLYCDRGSRSIICSRILARKGYVVYNLVNGIHGYKGQYSKR